MSECWTQLGVISAGGTVVSGATDRDGLLWIATPAGLFRRSGASWSPFANQPTMPFLQSCAAHDDSIFVGGLDQILFSSNGGKTWSRGQTTALDKPVTCLAASPNHAQDRVVLAGTDGAGILRSTDGGKHWEYSGFGLRDFSITALVAVPEWGEREILFCATAAGLYRSPNGGRAWKLNNHGLEGCTVISIAPSPRFADDGIVLVGTEAHGIYRSGDGGCTWQPAHLLPEPDAEMAGVNALWLSSALEICLAGLDDGRILRSSDAGKTWATCAAPAASILCLFAHEDRLYAGMIDDGLLYSDDCGATWQADRHLSARQFTSLLNTSGDLLALGAGEGIWRSHDSGHSWESISDFDSILLTAAENGDALHTRLAGTAHGLLRADDADPDWKLVLPQPDVTTIFFSSATDGQRVWVGTWGGDQFVSEDGGRQWRAVTPLPIRAAIVCVGSVHNPGGLEQLVTVTFQPRTKTLTLWRLAQAGWQIWLESPAETPTAHIVAAVSNTDEIAVSLGDRCWQWALGAWYCTLKTEKPILRLLRHPKGGLVALTADRIVYSADLVDWAILTGSPGGSFDDLALLADGATISACVLFDGGMLMRGNIDL